MTLPRYRRLVEHWNRFPPVRVLVAGAIGFKPNQPKAKEESLPLGMLASQPGVVMKKRKKPISEAT